MQKKYESPEMDVIELEVSDAIVASGGSFGPDGGGIIGPGDESDWE